MSVRSAGLLLYRYAGSELQLLLVHPGGPFWAKRDAGAWSIPKGIYEQNEHPLQAAKREFKEETGYEVEGHFIDLGEIKQPSGKIIHAWAIEQDIDTANIVSNTFRLEWPRNSGNVKEYPEIDKGEWFKIDQARRKILKGQADFIEKLIEEIQ
ncbi:MAG: NUDIX domain-containing protein [Arenicellales bacterium]|nr:NUDIX domain-containing protein [Arenicellales bacterium]